jgi:glycosyltransferase involved in cell wall biosynthesis
VKRTILVEGWRWIPHSYAAVNQWQCLEFLKRPDVALYHKDVPYFNSGWLPQRGIFSPENESALERMAPFTPDVRPDTVYRIAYRMDVTPETQAAQTVVFGTSEWPGRRGEYVYQGQITSSLSASQGVLIVTPSQWSKEGLVRVGADPARIRVIPHGVDIATYHPLEPGERVFAKQVLGLNGFIFLHVGAMTVNKGLDRLLPAFAAVCRKHPHSVLLFKGLDSVYPSRQLLDEHLSVLSSEDAQLIRPRIRYRGGVFRMSAMARLYAAADAYVSPYKAEAFNLPVLEAAACGLPIICTGGGPTDEFTTPQFARYIASQRIKTTVGGFEEEELQPDQEHLAELMHGIIEDNSFSSQAALAGPTHVRDRFAWSAVVDQLVAVFAESR